MAIGGDEIAHFLEWVDFSGNGVQAPVGTGDGRGPDVPEFLQPA